MHHTQSIHQLLTHLRGELAANLPANLAGLYLRGSLATGDFRPASSDIDLLVVTHQRVRDDEFARLVKMHNAIAQGDFAQGDCAQGGNAFTRRIEIAYIDRYALRRFQPGQHFPMMGQGEALAWAEQRSNWILERWMVREFGIAFFGPLPITLIDSVSPSELVDATRDRLQDWAAWASDLNDPEWQWPRRDKFYVVETICRALHTLATATITSKPHAVHWASQNLPEPWPALIRSSRSWQLDDTADPTLIEPVCAFVLWAAAFSHL